MWISFLAGIRTDTQGHPRSTEPFPKSSQRPPVRNGRHLTPAQLVVHHCASTGGQTTLVPEQSAEQHNTNRSCSHWQERDSGLALPTRSVLLLEDTQSDSTDSSSQHLSSARCQPGYPLSAWSHFHSYPSSPHCSQPSLFSDRYCNCHFLNPTI